MELRSIQSPVISSISTKRSVENRQLICYRQLISLFGTNRITQSNAVKFKPIRFNVHASATVGLQPSEVKTKDGEKDDNVIFVAGATGKVGSRTVRELLKLGFNVRAGVLSTQRAESLVKSVQQMKLDDCQPIEKLQLVECDLEKPEQIKPALGNASTVICCIGASEKEIFDVTGPYRIDFQATKYLINAAAAAKAKHFILVTSLGTNKFGFPAAVLNLFWGVLCWKRNAEEALLASGIPYTIVRPGGMERPTDSFKETHNLTLSPEDTLFGGLVSNLQVAELLAFMAKNPDLSYCKVVEVVAETTAPLTPMGDLLTKIRPKRPIPYQPKEPEAIKAPEPVSKSTIIESSSIATETQSQSKTASTRPLSPYTAYEGLKPPTSPTPTQPGGSKAVVEAVSAPTTDPETSTKLETITITTEPAPVTEGLLKTRPLSPYTTYENLKPPTSPCPNVPSVSPLPTSLVENGSPNASTSEDTSAHLTVKPRPLSPYSMYENLKPPSSPTPSTPQ